MKILMSNPESYYDAESKKETIKLLLPRVLRTAVVGFVGTFVLVIAFGAMSSLLVMAASKGAIESDFSSVVSQLDRLNSSKSK